MWIFCASVAGGLIFWFTSAPLMRYGCLYVYLTAAVFAALVWRRLDNLSAGRLLAAMLLVFVLWKGISFGREFAGLWKQDGLTYLSEQKDYPEISCTAYEIDGFTFYHADGKGTGYHAFPSSPFPAKIRLRGTSLREGFEP